MKPRSHDADLQAAMKDLSPMVRRLSREEQLDAVARAQKGSREAMAELVGSVLPWIGKCARSFLGRGVDAQDLLAEGMAGAMEACEKFDLKERVAFLTYATFWIRQRMMRTIQNHGVTVRVPANAREEIRKLSIPMEHWKHTGMSADLQERLRDAVMALGGATTLEIQTQDGSIPRADPRVETPLDLLIQAEEPKEVMSRLQPLLRRLSRIQREVVSLRWGLIPGVPPMTLREVGDQFARSREWTRQVEDRALRQLIAIAKGDPQGPEPERLVEEHVGTVIDHKGERGILLEGSRLGPETEIPSSVLAGMKPGDRFRLEVFEDQDGNRRASFAIVTGGTDAS